MSATPSHERDDQLLIRYLVGSLSEDETERLDELSIEAKTLHDYISFPR